MQATQVVTCDFIENLWKVIGSSMKQLEQPFTPLKNYVIVSCIRIIEEVKMVCNLFVHGA